MSTSSPRAPRKTGALVHPNQHQNLILASSSSSLSHPKSTLTPIPASFTPFLKSKSTNHLPISLSYILWGIAMGGAEENRVWRKQHKATCIVGQRWSHVHRTDHRPAMFMVHMPRLVPWCCWLCALGVLVARTSILGLGAGVGI
jgi:hypothetical protein